MNHRAERSPLQGGPVGAASSWGRSARLWGGECGTEGPEVAGAVGGAVTAALGRGRASPRAHW